MKLKNIELPKNLYWQNEFDHKDIAQSVERSVSGKPIVESAALSYGQPMTLTGAWINRVQVKALRALEASSEALVLTLNDQTTHSVIFDISSGGLQAKLLSPEIEPTDQTLYQLTINLLTVAP